MNRQEYCNNGNHLPEFLKDFHDQKDLFKAIVERAIDENNSAFVLLSTTTSSVNICKYVDEIMESRGGVSRDRVNPNSLNEIRLWVIDK